MGSRGHPLLLRPTRLDQTTVVQRSHACINAYLPGDTINGEALLLLKIWRIHPVEISHLDGVYALCCCNLPLRVIGFIQTRLNDHLCHIFNHVDNAGVLVQSAVLVYREQ